MTLKELAKLERLLREAPSSVSECAALLRLPNRRTQIGIWQLTSAGKAGVVGRVPNPDYGQRGFSRLLNLYGATAR